MADKTLPQLDAVVTPVATDILLTRQAADTEDRRYTRAQIYALLSGEHFILPQVDEVATPTLAFGDGDSGVYEVADDVLAVAIAGVRTFSLFSGGLNSNITNAWQLLNEAATATNPTLIPHVGEPGTGIGANAAGSLSLIGQSIELVRGVGNASALLRQVIISPGALLGAIATPALALGDGDSGLTELIDDQLSVVSGGILAVRYTGANSGVLRAPAFSAITADNVSQTQASGTPIINSLTTLISLNASDSATLPAVFPVDTIIEINMPDVDEDDATAVIFPAVGDDLGNGVNAGYTIQPHESVIFRATVANSTWVRMPRSASTVKPLFASGGMVRDITSEENEATLCPRGDQPQDGIGSGNPGEVGFVSNRLIAEKHVHNGGGVLQVTASRGKTITAFATGGQGSAVELLETYNIVTVVGTAGDSVRLPAVFQQSTLIWVTNADSTEAMDLFPSSGDDLGAGTDTAISVAAGSTVHFIATAANATWLQLI